MLENNQKNPEIPENTQHTRKYPKVKKDTWKYPIVFFDTLTRPEPDPATRYFVHYPTRPDPILKNPTRWALIMSISIDTRGDTIRFLRNS